MQKLANGKDKVGTLCAAELARGMCGNQEIFGGGVACDRR